MRIYLSLLFSIAALISCALPPGRLVRVEIDTTGIFEISHSELKALGYENPASVAVYGYGGVAASGKTISGMPEEVPAAAFMHTADGRLLFYGEADVRATLADGYEASFIRNSFDTGAVYFLSDAMPEARAQYPATPGLTQPLDYHYHIELMEREVQSPGNVGTNFHSTVLKPGDRERYSFPIKNYKTLPTGSMVMFRYDIAINSPYVTKVTVQLPENVKEVLNQPLQSIANLLSTRLFNISSGNAIFTPPSVGAFDNATVDIDVCIASVFRGTYASVDRAYIVYPRTNRLSDSELFLNFNGISSPKAFAITGADKDAEVWNVTNPCDIRSYELVYEAESRTAVGTLGYEDAYNLRLVAFNPSVAHRTPRISGVVEPAGLLETATPDYLIVTTSTLLAAARELARIHADLQGLEVYVATQEDIYNEFSSGMRMPEGIRRFVKSLSDKTPGKLRRVLLYGPSEWDVRHITGVRGDCLPSYICEEPTLTRDLTTAFYSDMFYGMTDDDFSTQGIYRAPQEISVGRLPLPDLATAFAVNEKTRRRLLAEPSAATFLHVAKFSDDGDARAHFDYSEEVANLLTDGNPAITVSRADNHLYPWENDFAREASRKLLESLRMGAGLMYFTGHGSATGLTAQAIYNVHFIEAETYTRAPLAFFASCVTYPFDGGSEAMVPRMVFSRDGGAIGAIGACRPVYLEQNRPLSNAFARAYAAAQAGESGADIFRDARRRMLAGGITAALGYNTLCYNYCGDPALPLDAPEYSIEFSGAGEAFSFRPQEVSGITGRILNKDGVLVDSFNGTVFIEVYDLPESLHTLKRNDDDGEPVEVLVGDRLLAEFCAPVKDGVFTAGIALPEVTGTAPRRIVVTAVDAGTSATAAGVRDDLLMEESGGNDNIEAPRIISFHTEGERVPSTFTANVRIQVSHAGLAPQQGLVKGLTVSVDGKTAASNTSISRSMRAEGIVDAAIEFQNLAPGAHTIVLRVSDPSGRSAEASLQVLVDDTTLAGTLHAADADPAREDVLFTLEAPEDATATLMIVAADGTTTLCRRGCAFPFRWNLRDSEGKPVADGRYRAYVLLEAPGAFGSTENVEITVLKAASYNKN